ncbi:MAG: hypothetical protein F4Y41_21285 [Gammaproteobacteria bacterium]|nr:hypothetical protein [Gammaproteobacteria bacterium]
MDSLETARHFEGRGYGLMTSPTLSPGQTVTANLELAKNVDDAAEVSICIRVFDADDKLMTLRNTPTTLDPGARAELTWTIPDLGGYPVAAVGVQLVTAPSGGTLYLDRLHWTGAPEVKLSQIPGSMWNRAWVNGVDQYLPRWGESFRLVHNRGTGLLLHGARDWEDYRMSADVTPHLIRRAGIAARVQGMRRYYALVLNAKGSVQIVRELDGTTVLAEAPLEVEFYRTYQMEITVSGNAITGAVDGETLLETEDDALATGGIALLIDEGRTATQAATVSAV